MGNANGKVTKPVNTDDVFAVTGVNSHDVVTLCCNHLHGRINPASKCKPIRFDKPSSLSDDDRLGSSEDRADGFYYGVHLANMQSSPLVNMHTAKYEYRYVRAGVDWARLDDFVGYDRNAKYNPYAVIGSTATKEDGIPVKIYYTEYPASNPSTGIDLGELIPKLTSDANFTLAKCYPCALVTLGSNSYVRALWCESAGFDTPTFSPTSNAGYKTLYSSGWQQNWTVPIDDLPNLKAGDTVKVTVFFMQYINHTAYTAGKDFRKWVQVTSQLANQQNCFTCPQGVAKDIKIESAHPKAAQVTGVILMSGSGRINWQWLTTDADKPKAGTKYTIHVTLRPQSGSGGEISASGEFTAPSNPTSLTSPITFTHQAVQGTSAVTYNLTWYIKEQGYTPSVNSGSGTAVLPKA